MVPHTLARRGGSRSVESHRKFFRKYLHMAGFRGRLQVQEREGRQTEGMGFLWLACELSIQRKFFEKVLAWPCDHDRLVATA